MYIYIYNCIYYICLSSNKPINPWTTLPCSINRASSVIVILEFRPGLGSVHDNLGIATVVVDKVEVILMGSCHVIS